ncbi:hypothetical protein ACH4PR_26395 [Streptomyces mirabilis]|uniref:hypothetical protein n=1 Tax=Streptomyces mirabilis TaxID=68239 RepID=UPI0037A17310
MTTPPAIALDVETHREITLLARAWGTTPAHAVRQLIDHFNTPAPGTVPDQIPVYAIYAQVRIDGTFSLATASLTIPGGPGRGHRKSPSGASAAVLRALRPDIAPIRSGWSFWKISTTGERLDTLRPQLRRTSAYTRSVHLTDPINHAPAPAPEP